MARLTPSRIKDLNGYHGVRVVTDGLIETTSALNEIATKYPQMFRQALGAEVANLKKSIAATLRNYKITKAVPVPNLIEATSYRGVSFPKRSAITKILNGDKNHSALADPRSPRIESINGGLEVGHFGRLSQYAIKFQEGVPRQIDSPHTRQWMYWRLNHSGMDVHSYEQLAAVIAPVSPPRPYIGPLAEKCRRDFIPGLVKCFEKIANGAMKRASRKKK